MNRFEFRAIGRDFDVDAFLETSSLAVGKVWHRGQLRGHPDFIQDEHPNSGFRIPLGDGAAIPWRTQEELAIQFLMQHRQELIELSEFPDADTRYVSIHIESDAPPNCVGFAHFPSMPLMWHALNSRVQVLYYFSMPWPDWMKCSGVRIVDDE